MSLTDRFRKQSAEPAAPPGSDDATPVNNDLPVARYDKLNEKEIASMLTDLSQVELAAVEEYERAHDDRAIVLDRLRYVRTTEPFPGYDTLTVEQVLEEIEGADGEKLRAVRDYERKFQDRQAIATEIMRVLPTSQASAGEAEAKQAKVDLVANRPGA